MIMTKEELESKSDFEINELTAIKLGLNISKEQWMHLGDRDENLVIIDTSKDSSDIINRTFDTVDYCNNWADMGPLLLEELIETAPLCNGNKWKAVVVKYDKRGNAIHYISKHKNPLRAAAIVYLLRNG